MSHFVLPLPFYLFILAEWLFAVFVFFSLICSLPHLFSSRAVAPLLVRKYVWQKHSALGLHCFFMWGPVVTLKACYVVCRFASAQLLLSVLRTLVCAWFFTWSLPGWKLWSVGKQRARTCWLCFERVCTFVACLKIATPPLWRVDVKPHKCSTSHTYVTHTESSLSGCTAEVRSFCKMF